MKFVLILFLHTFFYMPHNSTPLDAADLIECVSQSFNSQNLFPLHSFTEPSEKDREEYAPSILSKTLKNPRQYTLFDIPADEIHLALDSNQKITAVFIRLDNQDLVKKMEKAIGDEYIASGSALGEDEVIPHYYQWDYKGGCASLMLRAYGMMRYIPKIVRDDGLVTFFKGDPTTYMDFGIQTAEADEPNFTDTVVLKQKNEFLKLAYSFYPKGLSDQDELYGMTPQFRNLYQTLQRNEYLDEKWQQLLHVLQQRFECWEVGIPDPIMRGYRIAIVLKTPKPHYIVVNVSKLLPYYCFYTQSAREGLRISQRRYFTFDNFIPSDQGVVDWVSKQIQLHFEGYTEFPSALPLVAIEDVEFEERGFLSSKEEYRAYFQSMTLFNAFFSSNMFY
jgi:hypothetical protein